MNRQFDKFTAIYTRIDYPGDSWAVQVQMRSLEQYAKEQGFDNLHHYSDNGFSGITAQRPAFQRMLQDTVILCFSLFKTGSLAKSLFNAH